MRQAKREEGLPHAAGYRPHHQSISMGHEWPAVNQTERWNMVNELADLIKAVDELAEEEGISFADALDISIKALRYETYKRKQYQGESGCGSASSLLKQS